MKQVIEKFKPQSGYHSVSNSIKQIFSYYGHDIEEEMIFGLASALNFYYFEFNFSKIPFLGGRNKIGDFEENLAQVLNIKIKKHETSSKKRAFSEMLKMIKNEDPVLVYVDMGYLPYLNLPDHYHFGGHSVIVFGCDDSQEVVYISDRDSKDYKITLSDLEDPAEFHILSFDNLTLARSSKEKPYSPKNCWLTFDFNGIQQIDRKMIFEAILKNSENFLNPPGKNLGILGIELFSEKVRAWSEMTDEDLRFSAYHAFVMINQIGGTGGGCFRKIYGNFLRNSGDSMKDEFIYLCGVEYLKIAEIWDKLAYTFYEIYQNSNRNKLNSISEKLFIVFLREKELFLRLVEYIHKNQ